MPTVFFDKELCRLRETLAQMGGAVERMLDTALAALRSGDVDLADQTIALDKGINDQENRIINKTILLIATNQPVAGDLRFLAASLRMASELERIGDLAANLARRAKTLAEVAPRTPLPDDVDELADMARHMLGLALNAFADRDQNKAGDVLALDDGVDDLNRQVRRRLVEEIAADGSRVHWGLEIINTAAHLERLGDHATNLAEEVIYIYSGHNVRHSLPSGIRPSAEASAKRDMAGPAADLADGRRQDREDVED